MSSPKKNSTNEASQALEAPQKTLKKQRPETSEPPQQEKTVSITLVPTESTLVFPQAMLPLSIEGIQKLQLFRKFQEKNQLLGFIIKKRDKKHPQKKDLYTIGTTARILRIIHLSSKHHLALLEGKNAFRLLQVQKTPHGLKAEVELLQDKPLDLKKPKNQALLSSLKEASQKVLDSSPTRNPEIENILKNPVPHEFFINSIAANLTGIRLRQRLITIRDVQKRTEVLLKNLLETVEFLKLKEELQEKLQTELDQEQKEIFLQRQIKILQNQLQDSEANPSIKNLLKRAQKNKWTKATKTHFDEIIEQLRNTHAQGAEYTNTFRYATLLANLPWGIYTKDRQDLHTAQQLLEANHYGMEKVKERLLEFLAVHALKKGQLNTILCLAGPPGVGKTTIAKSIAQALGRKFFKISLAGMHDEAKLLGHARTYVASKEGALLAGLKQVETANPVVLLDEIDKMDYNRSAGPQSILSILDPSQQKDFKDNYLDTPFDISQVLFIATANEISDLSWPLQDRLEIIELEGYATEEKIDIAQKYLIPKEQKTHGLDPQDFHLTRATLQHIIQNYTSESGVRELSRQIQTICRKVAKKKLTQTSWAKNIQTKHLQKLLGISKFDEKEKITLHLPGKAIGLAWSQVGGSLIPIEATAFPGKGEITLSGQLGEVMQESAQVALSLIKSQADTLRIDPRLFKQYDIHIHSTPAFVSKEGPSAGITLAAAIASLYTQRKVKDKIAMTGEITLQGELLPVGGIKEKILAAKRAGIQAILLNTQNKKHVQEIKSSYLGTLEFHYVDSLAQALPHILEPKKVPQPKKWHLTRDKS